MARNWEEVDEVVSVCFRTACPGTASFRARSWDLKCVGCAPHGHVEFSSSEDGMLQIPFPVASQAALRRLIVHESKTWITAEEAAAILRLPEVRALPEEMTQEERAIFDDAERLTHFMTCGWAC